MTTNNKKCKSLQVNHVHSCGPHTRLFCDDYLTYYGPPRLQLIALTSTKRYKCWGTSKDVEHKKLYADKNKIGAETIKQKPKE